MADAPLLVPVHVDAMVLSPLAAAQTPFLRGRPDYERLHDMLPIGPPPFGGDSGCAPAPGVYLHWTLPAPLRRAVHEPDKGTTTFPPLPNRWALTRSRDGAAPLTWLIESDHLDPLNGTNSFVAPDGTPTRIG
ncbi:MAG TPA: hypothetical protein VFZ89_17715, partial [Solirubrobacteraceae bacterium]